MFGRVEFRRDPSVVGAWQEVDISYDYPGSPRMEEKVLRNYREAVPGEDLDAVRASGKMVILAAANPDIWIVEV